MPTTEPKMSDPKSAAPISAEDLARLDALEKEALTDAHAYAIDDFVRHLRRAWPAIRARIAEMEKRADDAWVRAASEAGLASMEEEIDAQAATIDQQAQRIAELEQLGKLVLEGVAYITSGRDRAAVGIPAELQHDCLCFQEAIEGKL